MPYRKIVIQKIDKRRNLIETVHSQLPSFLPQFIHSWLKKKKRKSNDNVGTKKLFSFSYEAEK